MPHKYPLNIQCHGKSRLLLERIVRAGKNGIGGEQLFGYLYDQDPNGGPLTGRNILSVMVWHLNKKLKSVGKRIEGGQGGRHVAATYRLVDL